MDRRDVIELIVSQLSVIQFGYHIGELNPLQPYIGCEDVEGLVTRDCIPGAGTLALPSSIFALGGLIGSALAGPAADRLGRRAIFLVSSLLYLLGSYFMYESTTVSYLTTGRILVGIASGSSIVLTPLLISDLAPPGKSGAFGCLTQSSINVGILIVQALGMAWADGPWRRLFLAAYVLSCVSLILTYYAIRNSRRATDETVNNPQRPVTVTKYVNSPQYRSSLYLSVGIMLQQQLTGINCIIFYGVGLLYARFGSLATIFNFGLSLGNLLATVVTGLLIMDKLTRRAQLCISLLGMAAFTFIFSTALICNWTFLTIFAMTAVIIFFALGMGPIPFLIISEHTPVEASGAAQSIGTSVNWIATFLVGALFPGAFNAYGPQVLMFFTVMSIVGCFILNKYLREE